MNEVLSKRLNVSIKVLLVVVVVCVSYLRYVITRLRYYHQFYRNLYLHHHI
jgi:hypothetical protein